MTKEKFETNLKRPANNQNKYTGVLAKPRPLYSNFSNGKIVDENNANEKRALDSLERLAALFKHYKIEPKEECAEMKLILALAENHIPGFQFEKIKKTAKTNAKWKTKYGVIFYANVLKQMKKGQGHSAMAAMAHLRSKDDELKDFTTETLNTRLHEIKKNFPFLKIDNGFNYSGLNQDQLDDAIINAFSTNTDEKLKKSV